VVEYGVNGKEVPTTRNEFQTTYTIDLKLPVGIVCARCVLQWTYQTANSADGWPETFRNCADVEIKSSDNNGVEPSTKAADVNTGASTITTVTEAVAITTTVTATAVTTITSTSMQQSEKDSSCVGAWAACGGQGHTGSTCCVSGYMCEAQSEWYHQCVPGTAAITAATTTKKADPATTTAITTAAATVATTQQSNAQCIAAWGTCGGQGYIGQTCCVSGHMCQEQSVWYHQCVPGGPPAPGSITTTTAATTTNPTTKTSTNTDVGVTTATIVDTGTSTKATSSVCITHAELIAVNSESGYWPQCDLSQTAKAGVSGPANYIFGHYCSAAYVEQLSEMFGELGLCGGRYRDVRRRFLAQVAYETGYYSTLEQPADSGAGMIHMIPANWRLNVVDMETLFPDQGHLVDFDTQSTTAAKAAFFRAPERAWKSAAAWMKLTNRVISGCGKDLFKEPYDEMTRCILGRVVDRSEALTLVSKHVGVRVASSSTAATTIIPPTASTSATVAVTTSTAPTPPATTLAPQTPGPIAACVLDGSTGFEHVFPEANDAGAVQIHSFFKDWALSYNGKSGVEAAKDIRKHITCAIKMKPAAFGKFCNSGDKDTDLREAAAFFANVRKETGGFSAMEEQAGHRYCTSDPQSGPSDDLKAAGVNYPCGAEGASYHGRGAIQLSWNINYGRFSEFLYGDKQVLLTNPDLVVPAGTTGWASTLWFWMSNQDYGGTAPPVQLDGCVPHGRMSPHDAMVSAGDPTAAATDPNGNHAGMARTINIINGGWECAVTSPLRSSPLARMQSYLDFSSMLQVAPHPTCTSVADCANKGINLGAGCPLLEADEVNACPLVCTQAATPDWTNTFRVKCSKCAGGRKPRKTVLANPCPSSSGN
jgi:hypothetical protein